MIVGVSLILCTCVISAVSQVLLKRAARKKYGKWFQSYLNPLVIVAYLLLGVTTILGVVALKYIPLSLSVAVGASSQIFVPVASRIFLGEKISRGRVVGMLIIVLGIIIFSL